jgi:protein-S-isoprenylcysteine O-methyltransferase Ste14
MFFIWVERNCELPWFSEVFNSSIFKTWGQSLILKCFWNISLFLFFGFVHSLMAQKAVQRLIERVVPPQLIRTLYLCVTGMSLFGVMALWQMTGVVLWEAPLNRNVSLALSLGAFWIPMLYAGHLLTRFGALEFLGIKQHGMRVCEIQRTEGTPDLIISGVYRWVRHPVYTCTLLAFVVSPVMTLDRFLLFFTTLLYLSFGIPIEEKKLERQFGQAYLDYRTRIPALVPFLR